MFTGIVEETGTVVSLKTGVASCILCISAEKIFGDLSLGDSVAVNGVCLTATSIIKNTFTADVMNETLKRSSLGQLTSGSHVNLERAMPANGRFGGHIVSGHIDGTGTVSDINMDANAIWYTIAAEPVLLRYIAEKGSVAIDGISLTVAVVSERDFRVSVIPHTAKATTLSQRRVGSTVNIENDPIAKYIEKLLGIEKPKNKSNSGITKELLMRAGY